MSAVVDWHRFPEPWRRIGRDFARMLPALCSGNPVSPPQLPPSESFEWIAKRWKKMGLSQYEKLARLVGRNRMTISDYENGQFRPSPATRKRLAAIVLPETPP